MANRRGRPPKKKVVVEKPEISKSEVLTLKIKNLSKKLVIEAHKKAELRDISGAIELLKNAIRLDASNIDAFNMLGLCYYETGEMSSAIKNWVISQSKKGEDNLAVDYLEKMRESKTYLSNIDESIAKYNKSLEYARGKSVDLAIVNLKKVVSLNNKFVNARLLLALCYLHEDKKRNAITQLEKVLKIDQGNMVAKRYLALLDEKPIPNVESKSVNKPTFSLGPSPIKASANVGLIRFVSILIGLLIGIGVMTSIVVPGIKESAKSDLENKDIKVSELSDNLAKVRTELSDKEREVGSLNEKLESSKKDLELSKKAQMENDNLFKAMNYYYKKDSDIVKSGEYLSLVDRELLSDSMGETYDSLAQEIFPVLARDFYNKGYRDYVNGRYVEGKKSLEASIKYQDSGDYSDDSLYYLARCYQKNNEEEESIKLFKQLIEKYPESPFADDAEYFINLSK